MIGGENCICGDGSNGWLHGFLIGRNLDEVPGRDGNVGGKETVTTKSEIGVVEASVVETMQAGTTRLGVASVGTEQGDIRARFEVGDI